MCHGHRSSVQMLQKAQHLDGEPEWNWFSRCKGPIGYGQGSNAGEQRRSLCTTPGQCCILDSLVMSSNCPKVTCEL